MIISQYNTYGNPVDVIELVDSGSEGLGDKDVRIAMEVCSINPADLLVVSGLYPIKPALPAIPGSEGVGKIIETGPLVTHVKNGDRVFLPFRAGLGTWRDEMIVTAKGLFALPNEADPLQLAMASVNPPSAYYMLTKYISLQEGDWIIQNAANSAVGRYVIAFAKNMGINTVNVVRREEVVDELQEAGGTIVLVDDKDLAKRVTKATNKAKILLGLDGVAGGATHRISQCLSFGGTVVNYGAMSLKRCELGATQTIFKQIKLTGIWLQKWTQMAPPEEVQALYKESNAAVISGNVTTKVDAIYPLSEIKKALTHASKERRNGKILLTGPAYQS